MKSLSFILIVIAVILAILSSCSTVNKKNKIDTEVLKKKLPLERIEKDSEVNKLISSFLNLDKKNNDFLKAIIDSLVSLKLYYDPTPHKLRDCSGIFYRVVQALRKKCNNIELPNVYSERSSRTIARWYHKRNKFILINDAIKQSNIIKPGCVLFFGRRWTKYTNLTFEKTFKQIYHIVL